MLTRKERSKETVFLLSNLLAIESKKMKETIEAFLKNVHRTKLFLHFFLCSNLIFNFSNFEKTFAIFRKVYFSRKQLFENLPFNCLPDINFRENGPRSRKSRKFLPAKVSARESIHNNERKALDGRYGYTSLTEGYNHVEFGITYQTTLRPHE